MIWYIYSYFLQICNFVKKKNNKTTWVRGNGGTGDVQCSGSDESVRSEYRAARWLPTTHPARREYRVQGLYSQSAQRYIAQLESRNRHIKGQQGAEPTETF